MPNVERFSPSLLSEAHRALADRTDSAGLCMFNADNPHLPEVRAAVTARIASPPALPIKARIGSSIPRPGDLMAGIFERMGIKHDNKGHLVCPNGTSIANCQCGEFRRQMNAWGFLGCLWHLPEIVEWFTVKANQCGIEAGDLAGLARKAIVGGKIDASA
jgi:hypothetical protein